MLFFSSAYFDIKEKKMFCKNIPKEEDEEEEKEEEEKEEEEEEEEEKKKNIKTSFSIFGNENRKS